MDRFNVTIKTLMPSRMQPCKHLVANATGGASYILGFLFVVFLSNIFHALLRSSRLPRMVAETLVGMIAGSIVRSHKEMFMNAQQTLDNIADFGMIFHMFALGLEMDPYTLFQKPTREALVAYSGMLSTFILACLLTPFFHYPDVQSYQFTFSLSVTLTGTASPLLTRILTDLKIGKSDIGRLVVSAGVQSDFVSTLLISIGFIILSVDEGLELRDYKSILRITSSLILQAVVTALVSPIFMTWVNHENPEGKPLKGSHMILSVAYVAISCGCSAYAGYSPVMSAFISGIVLPRQGRVSRTLIGKVNNFLNNIFYPIFFVWVGLMLNFPKFNPGSGGTWERMLLIFVISTLGKVAGTVLSGPMLGFDQPESVALGLLLNVKGHFHMFLALSAVQNGITTYSTGTGLTLAILFTVVYVPSVLGYIVERARKRLPTQRMALQWLDPEDELRILLCLHGPQQLPSTINFIEVSRGRDDPAIMVYVTEMIELTEQIEASLVHNEGSEAVTVTDKAVVEMRNQITTAINTYEGENKGSGMTLRRMLALSPSSVMHQDICIFAEDLLVTLVVLPFHKYQAADGKMVESQQTKFRYVNKKVLQYAPCSVGILVDRGFGVGSEISRSSIFLNAAVIFIGGQDDREALAYASHVALHPGVKLTVIRFLLDTNAAAMSTLGACKIRNHDQEEEMKIDDEFFANFYEKHVGQVNYMEKYLANSSETMSALQSLEGKYGLIIVGRGGRADSTLTAGMNDWQQCPELGPIGDILSGSNSVVSASILIIQQHRLKEELPPSPKNFWLPKYYKS